MTNLKQAIEIAEKQPVYFTENGCFVEGFIPPKPASDKIHPEPTLPITQERWNAWNDYIAQGCQATLEKTKVDPGKKGVSGGSHMINRSTANADHTMNINRERLNAYSKRIDTRRRKENFTRRHLKNQSKIPFKKSC